MSEGPITDRRRFHIAYSLQAMFVAVTVVAIVAGLSKNPPSMIVEGITLAFPRFVLAAAASGVALWVGVGAIALMFVFGRIEKRFRFINSQKMLVVAVLVALAATILWALRLTAIIEYQDERYRGLRTYTDQERGNLNHVIRALKYELQNSSQSNSEKLNPD